MDKLPPYNPDAEMAVIGCCLTDPVSCIPESALVIISPDFFYDAKCQSAWISMGQMSSNEVNLITIAERLKMPRDAAFEFLRNCQDLAFSTANLSTWLELIQDRWMLRKIIKVAQAAISAAYESKDALGLLDNFERDALKIRPARRDQQDMRSLLNEAVQIIERRARNWGSITGLSTGLIDLDQKSDGLHKGEMVVLAAFPSCGKTALAVNIAMHNALKGIPVGILSAEMRPVQLVIRSLCAEARVNFKHITESDCEKFIVQMGRFSKAPIYIQQANGWTIGQAMACARRWKQSCGIEMLVGDYIQRFQGIGDKRELQIASIGSGFKDIGMELEIPVLALSQLNDEGRLRESRALGMDGDSVWILKNNGEWKSDTQPVKLRIEKCRDGETGEVDLTFLKTITRFESASKIEDDSDNETD